jgi:UDP:flavonoid glycosyltransferase YjiC (YdhE family)
MSEGLFVTWDGGGNVAPAVEIAKELRRRGHHIRFLGQSQQREYFHREGFEFSAFAKPGPWTATGRRGPLKNAVGFLRLLTGRGLGRDLLAEVETAPVDLVIIDCLLFGVLAVAGRAGLRHAVLVHSLYEAIDTRMAGGAPGAIARVLGLQPRKLWAKSDLAVVATLRELDRVPGEGAPTNLRYTGPALPAVAGPARQRAETRVLVSLSTTYLPGQAAVIQKVLDALTDLPVGVVVTTGPAVDPSSLHAPPNAEVHGYLPHREVMANLSLVVGHGGHSTTMLALAHGLPLLVLPMNLVFDQALIGQAIQRSGAGLTIASRSPQHEIRAAIQRLLADETFAQKAARLGVSIRDAHGTEAAADLLLALIPQTPGVKTS